MIQIHKKKEQNLTIEMEKVIIACPLVIFRFINSYLISVDMLTTVAVYTETTTTSGTTGILFQPRLQTRTMENGLEIYDKLFFSHSFSKYISIKRNMFRVCTRK